MSLRLLKFSSYIFEHITEISFTEYLMNKLIKQTENSISPRSFNKQFLPKEPRLCEPTKPINNVVNFTLQTWFRRKFRICPDKHFYLHSGVPHLCGNIIFYSIKKNLNYCQQSDIPLTVKTPPKAWKKNYSPGYDYSIDYRPILSFLCA